MGTAADEMLTIEPPPPVVPTWPSASTASPALPTSPHALRDESRPPPRMRGPWAVESRRIWTGRVVRHRKCVRTPCLARAWARGGRPWIQEGALGLISEIGSLPHGSVSRGGFGDRYGGIGDLRRRLTRRSILNRRPLGESLDCGGCCSVPPMLLSHAWSYRER
jgi:hypothetical protein